MNRSGANRCDFARNVRILGVRWWFVAVTGLVAACGGGSSAPDKVGTGGGTGGGGTGQAPVITAQPQAAVVTEPAPASFSVVASGTAPLAYQWSRSGDGGLSYADIPGATEATYTLPSTARSDDGTRLRVRVSNAVSAALSDPAVLSVSAAVAPHFLYVVNANSWNLSAYAVSGTTGALTELPGSPYFPARGPLLSGVATDPSGRFLYVSLTTGLRGGIAGYAIDGSSGALATIAGSPFGSGPVPASAGPVAFHPNGRFLYVAHDSVSGIGAYAIDATSGALTPVPGSPFAAGRGNQVQLSADGRSAYLLEQNGSTFVASLHAYRVDATTGALAAVPGSPFALPSGALYGPAALHPSGRFVVVPSYANQAVVLAVDPASGVLSRVPGSPFTIASLATAGASPDTLFDASGRFVYFDIHAFTAASNPKTVYGFAMDGTTGALTALPGNPLGASFGSSPACGLTRSPDGRHVLQAGLGVASLALDAASGALTDAGSATVRVGASCTTVFEPEGRFVYSIGVQGIGGYGFDAATGALAPIAPTPWITPGIPFFVAFR